MSILLVTATPNVSTYQYDESSGYYYDSQTGLYYDPNSQYYYNSEIAAYLYWDPDKSTYVLAPQTDTTNSTASTSYYDKNAQTTAATKPSSTANGSSHSDINEEAKETGESKKTDVKQDKVKVAKKIVKDMERWAKQLNQKKENAFQAIAPIDEPNHIVPSPMRQQPLQRVANGIADVGFTIMENRESRLKPSNAIESTTAAKTFNKMLPYGSDSDNEADSAGPSGTVNEKDLIDFGKLTCLLCKRAFQSLDILNKHIKMSNLHKDNLQKLNGNSQSSDSANAGGLSYRDRAKERRLKYGEVDPPPPNRSRERFEKELRKQTAQLQKQADANLANTPIDQSNMGNRMLQKMGWSEGQGLGKSNQGRTNLIAVSINKQFESNHHCHLY